MALTKEDKNWISKEISESIRVNNRELIIIMSQNFLTKEESVSRDFLEEKLNPIKDQIRGLQEAVVDLDDKFTISIAMTDSRVQRLEEKVNYLNRI